MGTIKFDIRHPNGGRESAIVEADRALVGSGSHCDVRLPVDQAAHEHVMLEVVGGTLRAEAKVEQPPATVNDMPLTACSLGADSVLGIGRIRLFVSYVPDVLDGSSGGAAKKKGDGNPLVQLGLIVFFVGAAYMLLRKEDDAITPPPTETPVLFSKEAPACPRKNPTQALALAQERLTLANAQRERMPFRVTDGVAAVNNYREAASCFRTGKADKKAKAAESNALVLKDSITNDFRARRLRLSHMLRVEDFELAQKDVSVLRQLTGDSDTRFSQWLARTDKQLGSKLKRHD